MIIRIIQSIVIAAGLLYIADLIKDKFIDQVKNCMKLAILLIIINLCSIIILLFTTKYLNYIDAKAQKQFERVRQNIEYLESFDPTRKHYSNNRHE